MFHRPTDAVRRIRSGLRSWAAFALLGALLGAPGPGALVAVVGLFGGDHAHAISIEQDVTHADLVLCHDGARPADATLPAFAARDCGDDHRVHLAGTENPVLRGDARQTHSPFIALAVVSSAVPDSRPVARPAAPVFDQALADANRIHRTIVLRV